MKVIRRDLLGLAVMSGVPVSARGEPVGEAGTARVDVWTWAVRLYKTRSAATEAAKAGHIRINGERVKAAQKVRPGDEVRAFTDREHTVIVRSLLLKRVGAAVAAQAFDDLTPPLPPREERPSDVTRERGLGRPTKRDRRAIDRLRNRP